MRSITSSTMIALAAGAFAADPSPVMPLGKESDLKLTIGGQVQFRADWSQARNNAGQPYDVSTGTDNRKSDDLDFYLRRCRLYVKGSYGDFTLNFGLRADNADKAGTAARAFQIHYASVTRTWKGDSVSHGLQLGLDYAFFNSASIGSSSAHLLPAARATDGLLAPRGAGIGYRLDSPNLTFGADIQNNTSTLNGTGDEATPANSAAYQAEGLCYTARLEFTPVGAWAIKPKDYKESYAGKAGNGWMAALEAGYNMHDTYDTTVGDPAVWDGVSRWRDTLVVGAESLLHMDSLSALIEYRWVRQTANTDAGEPTSVPAADNPVRGAIFVIQAGYALPCLLVSGAVIEPVARYTNLDYNTASRESNNFGSGEYSAASGNQYDLGVNWYPTVAAYNHKVSLLWTHWLGESEGNGSGNPPQNYKPKADIVRAQYQWMF